MVAVEFSAVERLLSEKPFGIDSTSKSSLFLDALNEAFTFHFKNCSGYRRFCERRGFNEKTQFSSIEDIPFLPVQAFKEHADLLISVPPLDIKTKIQSSATSGVPSTIWIDKITAKRQKKALAAVMSFVLGPKRRPFLILDVDPGKVGFEKMGARSAAVRGFLNLALRAEYFMESGNKGELYLKDEAFTKYLNTLAGEKQPVVIFGFTFVLYEHLVLPMVDAGRQFKLPANSKVVHIGGWKKLEDRKVSKTEFNSMVARLFDIKETSVVDFYGFTEQMGIVYPDGPGGFKYTPAFAEVLVRDPQTYRILPDGEEGLLEFITPLPHSYPGLAVLTDDIGMIVNRGDNSAGWQGTPFKILGRAKKAEVRGCGDIMGERVAKKRFIDIPTKPLVNNSVRLLFGPDCMYVSPDLEASVDLTDLPDVKNIHQLAESLREGRKRLDTYSVDELIALINVGAECWMEKKSPLFPLRHQGLLFLRNWCRSTSLRTLAGRSLRGIRGYLDGFYPVDGTNRRLIRARERGLAVHWLSGNVPLLGMLTLVQSILTRNANLLKAASSFSSVLPLLLESFRDLKVKTRSGKILYGNDLLASIAVIYFPRDYQRAAEALSEEANIRLAWGGREAVETIVNLPKKYTAEDIIFGPKLSYMVIGKEYLSSDRLLRKMARRAATDVSVFDQYACASPHTIFVEKGGSAALPKEFAKALAKEMEKTSVRIPKAPVDAGTAGKIASVRMRYEFMGDLWCSKGTEWTVLYDDDQDKGLAEPCYSRVITVRAIDDALKAADFAHRGIQTIGVALDGPRKVQFADRATELGAERLPDLGRMTFFDTPWDGLFAMDRMVRWVTLGGPF